MAQTVVNLYNLALGAVGTKTSVTAVDQQLVEAETCTLFYESVRDRVFRAAPWSSLHALRKLVLAKERDTAADWAETDPPPGYLFAYTFPAVALAPRYMADYSRFEVTRSNTGVKWIASNTEDAILHFTERDVDIATWDIDLYMSVAYGLAAHIGTKLTGKNDRVRLLLEQSNSIIMQARVNDANAQDFQLDTVAPWHAARGVTIASDVRYIFPYGPVLSIDVV